MIKDTGWYKSSFSSGSQDSCVEVRIVGSAVVGVRDSKDPVGRPCWMRAGAWASLIAHVTRE